MKRNSLLSRKKRSAGFTIIELLVAVGVTALLVSLMLTIVVNVMGGWSRSSGSLTSGNQARMVLDMMSRDLQSAIFKRNGDVWLAATVQASGTGFNWSGSGKPSTVTIPAIPSAGNALPSLEESYRFGQAGVWLRFFTSVPGSNIGTDISAPRAVSYQIIRRSVSGASTEQSYMLHRSEVSSQATFTNGYNLYNNNDIYYTGDLRTPGLDTVIANNVVDLGVRCLKRNAAGQLELIFPSDTKKSFAATSDITKVGKMTADGEGSPVIDFPDVVEVFVRILTDEGAQQIANLEANPPRITGDWWEIVNANSRVFSRRVEIKAKSL